MKKYLIIILASSGIICSCLRCDDPFWGDDFIFLKYTDQVSGNDLFFGTEKIYDLDSLSVFFVGIEDSMPIYIDKPSSNYSNIIKILKIYPPGDFVLSYPNAFQDTFKINYEILNGKCSDPIHFISLTYKGTTIPKSESGIFEVLK